MGLNCPERKSICCNAISKLDSGLGRFVCSSCQLPFVGGKCTAGKDEPELTITFDKSATGYIIALFKDKFPLICQSCGKKITKNNLGGVTTDGFIHDNIVCLIQMVEKKKVK